MGNMGKKSIPAHAQSSQVEQHDFISVPQPVQEGSLPREPNGYAITATIIEPSGIGYNSLAVRPRDLTIFSSDLPLQIVEHLARKPQCTMDIARALGEHEQKIYYHIRKLEKAGMIRMIAREQRLSMTAKIYQLVAPAIHTTLNRADFHVPKTRPKTDQKVLEFLHPFVENGKLNSKIVIGDPYPHGKYDTGGLDAGYVSDLSFFLGNIVQNLTFPTYRLDVRLTEEDIKNNNLIIIGSPLRNTVAFKVNPHLPLYFEEENGYIVSKATKQEYKDDFDGVVIRCKNPFNPEKHILLLGGRRTRGTEAAVIAFTRHLGDLLKNTNINSPEIAKVVRGLDEDGDGSIDAVKIVE